MAERTNMTNRPESPADKALIEQLTAIPGARIVDCTDPPTNAEAAVNALACACGYKGRCTKRITLPPGCEWLADAMKPKKARKRKWA